jgi:hypothetical protein
MALQLLYNELPDALKSIRLLKIEPAWPNEPIQVNLIVVDDRRHGPAYDALSYVWGNDIDPDPIICNGIPKPITTNLAHALRALRPLPSTGLPSDHGVSLVSQITRFTLATIPGRVMQFIVMKRT